MAAERDWVGIVAEERCPDCGLAASQVARADLATAVQEEGRDWGALLRTATADELRASRLSSLAGSLDEHGWARTGVRRDREQLTVEGLIRFALHEAHHHRADASRAIGVAWPG
jgi:hypothetical protein